MGGKPGDAMSRAAMINHPARQSRRLPPNGRKFLDSGSCNPWVAIGPKAWDVDRIKSFPVMVLPDDRDPADFSWPVAGLEVLVLEVGTYNTARLERLAQALLTAGAVSVLASRTANPGELPLYTQDGRDA
jgi:hypothetical protein